MSSLFANLSPTSAGFLVFTALVLALYYLTRARHQNTILLAASFVFCASWDWSFAVTLAGACAVNYLLALAMAGSEKTPRTVWLYAGLGLNLGLLLVFKYLTEGRQYLLSAASLFGADPESFMIRILQPIGLSFYILQAISYLLDVYRRHIPVNRDPVEVALYLAYFPKLLAGPIERPDRFFGQLRGTRQVDNAALSEAFVKILAGLVRKLVISDVLLRFIPPEVFENSGSYTAPDLAFWWIVFVFVLYNDFAGYTSIVRGVSGLFGIELSPNFSQPFFSKSPLDFWNRWHISLSNWLRDYVYLPLSRWMLRRNQDGRYLPNLILPSVVTMLVSGAWHGLQPHFLLWGFLNGSFQAFERVAKSRRPSGSKPGGYRKTLGILGTLAVLLLIGVPFLLEIPETFLFWMKLADWNMPLSLSMNRIIKPVLGVVLSIAMDAVEVSGRGAQAVDRLPAPVRALVLAAGLVLLFLASHGRTATLFFYQEF